MRKHALLASVATLGIAIASPAYATQEDPSGISGSIDADLEYENRISTSIDTHTLYVKLVGLVGGAQVTGTIDVDSSAVAVVDDKQLLGGLEVRFRESTAVTDDVTADPTGSTTNPGDGLVSQADDPTICGDTQCDTGFFAHVVNSTGDINVSGNTGNLGINKVAGQFNQQENVAALATSNFVDSSSDGAQGWAEASLTVLQGAADLYYGYDRDNTDTDRDDYRDRNRTGVVSVTGGSGNLGVNVASGAFNQQKNALVIATATNAALAEANAGVIQASLFSEVVVMDQRNSLGALNVASNAGNVGINAAAGVGNQQLNSLVVASSIGTGAGVPTPSPTPGTEG